MSTQERPLILITNRFDSRLRASLSQYGSVDFKYRADLFSDLSILSKTQGLIIRSSTRVDKDLLNKMPNLKIVITATSGFDHMDLDLLTEKKIACFHIPSTQAVAAAEMTMVLLFNACRKFQMAYEQIQKGNWDRQLLLGRQIAGLSLGIIGLGRVGLEVAKRASALGMKVMAYDPYRIDPCDNVEMLGFEELMRSCDVISVHVPKTVKTRHMIKKETLSWMSSNAILINMSRGDVINETELIAHLRKNPDFIAALDVFTNEPLSIHSDLFNLKNVVLSPHIGASTQEALRASSQESLERTIAFFADKIPADPLPPKALWYENDEKR